MFIKKSVLVLCFFASVSFAQDVIKASYSYTYGDMESLVEARQTCKDLAIREAIESYSVYVESSTTVENFQLKEDIIQSISAGFLKDIRIIEQSEEGRTITMTIEATVDPSDIKQDIEKLVSTHEEEDETVPGTTEETTDEEASPFFSVLAVYEKRISSTEKAWKQKKFDDALEQIQGLKSLLQRYKPKQDHPFQWSMYQTIWSRTILLGDIIRQEQLETQGKRILARTNLRVVVKRAESLKKQVDQLEQLNNLSKPQQVLRTKAMSRCQVVLNLATKKVTARRRR